MKRVIRAILDHKLSVEARSRVPARIRNNGKRDEVPLPEPQGLVVTKRPNRLYYDSEEDLLYQGWTKGAIAKFLPAVPDLIGPSPFGEPGDPPVKYWLRRRVSLVRRTNKEYQAWRLGRG